MTTYPEHEKLSAISDASQTIGAFLDFLTEQDLVISLWIETGELRDPQLVPVSKTTSQILADYFGIDLARIETEKRAMLESLRHAQPDTEGNIP